VSFFALGAFYSNELVSYRGIYCRTQIHDYCQYHHHSSYVVRNPLYQKSEEIRQHVCKIIKFKGKDHKEPSSGDSGKDNSTKRIKEARKEPLTKYPFQTSCNNPKNQRTLKHDHLQRAECCSQKTC